uniref:Uncharacterized protein n=2 Tax=Rhodnius prolixus TaxID=13249 RepID=T1I0T4_RHOPR
MGPPSSSSRNYRSYELGHFTSQNSRNPPLNTYNNSNKVTFTSFYDSFELNNSNIRNTHFNRKTAAGRTRPYYNMHCSMLRAKKIAKRLKNKEDCEEGIDDLCLLMNIRKKQPLQAVMRELLLLLEEQNQMQNRRSEIDKSTQTVRSRQVVKKEFCTPIPEGFLKNIMETPILPTKMTVKLEKITPICK